MKSELDAVFELAGVVHGDVKICVYKHNSGYVAEVAGDTSIGQTPQGALSGLLKFLRRRTEHIRDRCNEALVESQEQ